MNTRKQLSTAVSTILHNHNIQVEQILLFGSQARGTARPDSDWDLYVLIDNELTFANRNHLTTKIKRDLAKMRIPNTLILKYSKHFYTTKIYPGHISYTVAQEGVPL